MYEHIYLVSAVCITRKTYTILTVVKCLRYQHEFLFERRKKRQKRHEKLRVLSILFALSSVFFLSPSLGVFFLNCLYLHFNEYPKYCYTRT